MRKTTKNDQFFKILRTYTDKPCAWGFDLVWGWKQIQTFNASSLHVLLLLGILAACTPQKAGKRQTNQEDSTSTQNTNPTPLSNISDNIFIQNGQDQISSIFTILPSFADSFFLRGGVHNFMIAGNGNKTQVTQCLLVFYDLDATDPPNTDKVLVLAALPKFFNNFSTNSREYYYQMQSLDSAQNQAQCQTVGILNEIALRYPGATPVYQIKDICTTCTKQHTSKDLRLFTNAGLIISELDTSHLSIRLLNDSFTNTPIGNTCNSSPQCNALGFDCCFQGQCVNDKSLKPGVDVNSLSFLQAQQDISQDASRISNYPEFYFICSSQVQATPTPGATPDAQATATARFNELQDLYRCINPTLNEQSICTLTYPDAIASVTAGWSFTTLDDDRTFESTYSGNIVPNPLEDRSIDEIIYAGETLYKKGSIDQNTKYTIGPRNDSLSLSTSVIITATPAPDAPDTTVKLRYQVDGSCVRLSPSLGRCKKHYVQGQNTGQLDDHNPATAIEFNDFKLPSYADTLKNIEVRVDNIVKIRGLDWDLVGSTVQFFGGATAAVNTSQKVVIDFFVSSSLPISGLKQQALDRVDQICDCDGTGRCNLKPVTGIINGASTTVDYACVYPPPPVPLPPLQQTVNISAKTVPVRFFDSTGQEYSSPSETTNKQEGVEFKYDNGNLLRPNNYSPVGTPQPAGNFNEIYGSITTLPGSPRTPRVINIIQNRTYDIFVDSGNFSSCLVCGTDYHSSLSRLFPSNFVFKGGGYRPDPRRTDRTNSNQAFEGDYRADDLLFGRACFVPATMLPWSHQKLSDTTTQRNERQKAQHFLFANGYHRDWYGFDYGAVIGSFDGVTWFAIGDERRITAKSNRLFLAINAYFGDQTQDNNYSITINESTGGIFSGSSISTSFNNSGAECQKFHQCTKDQDCVTQLGWDYVCSNITDLKTNWPKFDANGNEIPGDEAVLRIVDLLDGVVGSAQRCVYRGRGAICHPDYTLSDTSTTYSQTAHPQLHACSPGTYCQVFTDAFGTDQAKFNNRIARFARSPLTQNLSSDVPSSETEDTFGLAARSIGRPYHYIGDELVEASLKGQLNYNKVFALCSPGKEPFVGSAPTLLQQHALLPSSGSLGDRVLGLGMTRDDLTSGAPEYLNSCGIFDSGGDYYHLNLGNALNSLDTTELSNLAGGQALPTNALRILESTSGELVTDFENQVIENIKMQTNRCTRAPGSACFSDLDCGPNKFVTQITANIDENSFLATLNKYELSFWKEKLVCGQKAEKTGVDFDLKKNVCCRETGQSISIGTDFLPKSTAANFSLTRPNIITSADVPAIDYALDSWVRNSRISTIYTEMKNTPTLYPALSTVEKDACTTDPFGCQGDTENPIKQWKTFDLMAQKTCCSQSWVREFSTTNGGGHHWLEAKMQKIDKGSFECLNWTPCVGACTPAPFQCLSETDPTCTARNITIAESNKFFDWIGTLELIGVPQVLIRTNDTGFSGNVSLDISCNVDPVTQLTTNTPLPDTILDVTGGTPAEYQTIVNQKHYAAHDLENFDGLKQVFSEDKVACCVSAGDTPPSNATDNMCCTGKLLQGRCCLEDFTDVTLYLNRYISSEANALNDSLFDSRTGYLKDPNIVAQIAASKNICCSGLAPVPGVAVSNLKIKGFPNGQNKIRRFVSGSGTEDNENGIADLYESGLRWNNHLYCVPQGFTAPTQ